MKLIVLSENHALSPRLRGEFGLSVYLEKGAARMVFDLGSRDAAVVNAKTLGVDLTALTAIAFSHNHFDHTGGMLALLGEHRPACPVYVHSGFWRRKWVDRSYEPRESPTHEENSLFVGTPFTPEICYGRRVDGLRMVKRDLLPLGEDIYLVSGFAEDRIAEPIHPSLRAEDGDGNLVRDDFRDEQVLAVRARDGLVVLSGCAHHGIMTVLRTVGNRFPGERILAVFGGSHLDPPDPVRIRRTLVFLRESGIRTVGLCHCTGETAGALFRKELPSYVEAGAGFVWETEDAPANRGTAAEEGGR